MVSMGALTRLLDLNENWWKARKSLDIRIFQFVSSSKKMIIAKMLYQNWKLHHPVLFLYWVRSLELLILLVQSVNLKHSYVVIMNLFLGSLCYKQNSCSNMVLFFFLSFLPWWSSCDSADLSQMGSSHYNIVVLWVWTVVLERCNIWTRVIIYISLTFDCWFFSKKTHFLLCVDTFCILNGYWFCWTGIQKNWLKLKQNWFVFHFYLIASDLIIFFWHHPCVVIRMRIGKLKVELRKWAIRYDNNRSLLKSVLAFL